MHQTPDPNFVITIKDIYREAAGFARIRGNFAMDDTGDSMEEFLRMGFQDAQDLAKICTDPRGYTLSQENAALQDALIQSLELLERIQVDIHPANIELLGAIERFFTSVSEKLHFRKVTPEEAEVAKAQRDEFIKNTNKDTDTAEEPKEDNILEFRSSL